MEKLRALAGVRGQSLLDVISDDEVVEGLPAKARDSVKQMAEIINLCRDEQSNLTISDIYDNLLIRTGYMKSLEEQNTQEAEARIENLLDFKSFIFDFESGHRRRCR